MPGIPLKSIWVSLALVLLGGYALKIDFDTHTRNIHTELYQEMASQAGRMRDDLSHSVARLHQLAKLFATEQHALIQTLFQAPQDRSARRRVREKLRQYFPEMFAFTLADTNGDPLLEDKEGAIGRGCRLDIKHFAAQPRDMPHVYSPHIHFNRLGGRLAKHFDVMIPWNNGREGVVFISVRAIHLTRMMQRYQEPGFRMLLLNRDDPGQIELAAGEDISDKRLRRVNGPASDLNTAGAIDDTAWLAAAQLQRDYLARKNRAAAWRDIALLAGWILMVILASWLLHRERTRNQRLTTVNAQFQQELEQRRATEAELHAMLHFDPLTRLPNRQSALDHLGQFIAIAQQQSLHPAVLSIDIDRFSVFNDSLGHQTGDVLLRRFAERLQSVVVRPDIPARWAGDQFLVIIQHAPDHRQLEEYGLKIMATMKEPIAVRGKEVEIDISLGIATFPDAGTQPETLIANADIALHRSKSSGRGCSHFFIQQMNDEVTHQMELEAEIRQALPDGGFEPWYQPKLDLANGQLCGSEVLVRWRHKEKGILPPAGYLGFAERSGLIARIDEAVRTRVCIDATQWMEEQLPIGELSLNLSGVDFYRDDLVEHLQDRLSGCGLDPGNFQLEITEGQLMQDTAQSLGRLYALKELGFRLAVDDFGTGYSSLAYLKRFPVDVLKIDRSFVCECHTNREDRDILKMIVELGHSLSMTVLAEGVETMEQYELLRDMGCDQIQGFLIARAMPASDFADFVHNFTSLDRSRPISSSASSTPGTSRPESPQ